MRMRLGLLQDSAAIDRQIAREQAEAEIKRKRSEVPTVKTEAQAKTNEAAVAQDKESKSDKAKTVKKRPNIRPLSEAKAIDSGANFISEGFLFLVAGGLIVLERWWSTRRENNRREDVAERISSLESEVEVLKAQLQQDSEDEEKPVTTKIPTADVPTIPRTAPQAPK